MIDIKEIDLNDDGSLKQNTSGDHTLYKMPDYKNDNSLNCIKNKGKLDLLRSRCMNLDIYPPKMIKLLLDGDYRNELNNYKSYVIQFINEILEKKIPYTRLGIQTKLYKLITNVKKGGTLGITTDKKKGSSSKAVKSNQNMPESESESEGEDEINDIDTLKSTVLNYALGGDKKKAVSLVHEYLEPHDPLFQRLILIISRY